MQLTCRCICFDLPAISRFFRSCALTIAVQQTTKMQWTTYRDSKVLNAAYALLFWKEPLGFVEVHSAPQAELERLTDKLHEQYLLAWVQKLSVTGPEAAERYVADMVRVREYAKQATQDLFREVGNINNDILGETQQAISKLAMIKLGAQVGVAAIAGVSGVAFGATAAAGATGGAGLSILGMTAGGSALSFGAVAAGHSITHSVLKNWEDGSKAQFVGVAFETTKAVTSEVGSNIAGKSLEAALTGSAKSEQIMRSAQGEINKYSAKLAQEGLKKKAAAKAADIVARRTAQVAVQQTAQQGFLQTARFAARAVPTIPVAFAVWDVWDAIGDYRDTTAANR